MEPSQLWTRYVRYIGAGAVAMAGIITLVKSLPTMIESFRLGAAQIRERLGANDAIKTLRTEFDLPLKVVGYGAVHRCLGADLFPRRPFNIDSMAFRAVAAVCVVVFAFFFVTVSSRIVGLVGVTSNPTSGMTIATLLGTAGIFLLLGVDGYDRKGPQL